MHLKRLPSARNWNHVLDFLMPGLRFGFQDSMMLLLKLN